MATETNGNGGNGSGAIKLSLGVSLQLAMLIAVIGIAWGTLSAKQGDLEKKCDKLLESNIKMTEQLVDIRLELEKLKIAFNRHTSRAGAGGAEKGGGVERPEKREFGDRGD